MYYFSFPYFFYIFITALSVVGLYFLFRKKTDFTKKTLLFSLMMINLIQHLFKSYIYPHMWGQGFTGLNTAYNMCAFLIIATPFIYLFGSELWKNFIVYVGGAAGICAILFPSTYWFGVENAFGWEAIRFYCCHILLVITSILPALFGMYKINWRKCFKIPILFFVALIIIIFNLIVCYITGLFDGGNDLLAFLRNNNPLGIFGPIQGYEWVGNIAAVFTPDILLKSDSGEYIPVLWYAIPIYVSICSGVIGFGAIFDKVRFKNDILFLKNKILSLKKHFIGGDNES